MVATTCALLYPPPAAARVLLYAGLAVFVLLAGAHRAHLWRAWNERAGQARTAAVFELVQQRMPSRPIEAPGAIAWLREQLAAYRAHLRRATRSTFERLSDETESVPAELGAATKAMRTVVSSATDDHPSAGAGDARRRTPDRRAARSRC